MQFGSIEFILEHCPLKKHDANFSNTVIKWLRATRISLPSRPHFRLKRHCRVVAFDRGQSAGSLDAVALIESAMELTPRLTAMTRKKAMDRPFLVGMRHLERGRILTDAPCSDCVQGIQTSRHASIRRRNAATTFELKDSR